MTCVESQVFFFVCQNGKLYSTLSGLEKRLQQQAIDQKPEIEQDSSKIARAASRASGAVVKMV
jgi:hypothetical protein